MPQYDFRCDCGNTESVIRPMSESRQLLKCSNCGAGMYREYKFRIGNRPYAKPLISDSLAISPDQAAEHRSHFPDVEVLSDGRLKFDSFKQHDNYLKKTGFVKKTQKLKRKGKTVARMK